MRMHTAVKLNHSIRSHSSEADLVIINFPAPPAKLSAEENCILYLQYYMWPVPCVFSVAQLGSKHKRVSHKLT